MALSIVAGLTKADFLIDEFESITDPELFGLSITAPSSILSIAALLDALSTFEGGKLLLTDWFDGNAGDVLSDPLGYKIILFNNVYNQYQ